MEKTTALAFAVKKVDPQSEIFGGVFYGYMEYLSMQNAPDWKAVNAGNKYSWYIDYFLDAMKKASDQAGKRLIDVLDLHWYSEAAGDHRINAADATTAKDRAVRLQAVRSLWDDTCNEKSWISQNTGGPINLLPRVQASIDKYFPGTRIAINKSPTETVNGTFTVAAPVPFSGIKAYGFDAASTAVSAKTGAVLGANGFTCALSPWSATHFVIKTNGALPPVGLRAPALRSGARAPGRAYLPDGRLFPSSRAEPAAALPLYLRP